MRGVVLFSVLTLAACASSGTANPAQPPVQSVRVVGGTGGITQVTTTATDAPTVATIRSPIDQVWRALPGVYQSIAIPVATLDSTGYVIGNPSLKIRRRLGDAPLTRYFDCGRTQDGPNAETYELNLSVMTQAQAGAAGTTNVNTTVQAMARPTTATGEFFRCSSKGVLEARINELLRAQLQS